MAQVARIETQIASNPIGLIGSGAIAVGLGVLAYYYGRGMGAAQEIGTLAQRGAVLPGAPTNVKVDRDATPTQGSVVSPGTEAIVRRPGAFVPLTKAQEKQIPHTDMITLAGQPLKPGTVGEWETFTSRSEKLRLDALLQARTQQGRSFAHFHPSIADPKQSHPKVHAHSNTDEMASELRQYTPQFFIRRTNVDFESGQRFYELILPIRTEMADLITDIAIKRLPNAHNLHRVQMNLSQFDSDDIQYTLGNLPKPAEDGAVHLDLGDSPLLLFKMLTRPLLIFSYKTEPRYVPELVLTVGKLKDGVRESLRRVANLAMPFDASTDIYTLYSIWNRRNVHLVDLPSPEQLEDEG